MSFEYLIALLFGSNLLAIYPDIKGSRWESKLLDCIKNPDDDAWRNAFDEAVKIGDVEGTSLLAKYCVKDPKDLEGPLFNIARRRMLQVMNKDDYTKNVLIVKTLVDSGVNVNATDQEETLLHASANRWGFDIARILIENGAYVNARDKNERSPLHTACIYDAPDVIKLLIDNGADVNARDANGYTPINIAAYFKDKDDVARAILKNTNNTDLEIKNNKGNTPLLTALKKYSPKVAKLLINYGANISEIDENGNDLLHQVINDRGMRVYDLTIYKALIDRGLGVNSRNSDGDTCLHLVDKFQGTKKEADFFIMNGADINAKNKNGQLPHKHFDENELKMLTFFADLKKDAAKAISESGIDINAIDGKKRTTLYWAVYWNQTDAVRILVENGADIKNTDYGKYIPILYAGYFGCPAIVRILVEHGVDVDDGIDNITALFWAAQEGHAYTCKVLIELGANINSRNLLKETPLHVATYNGHVDVVRILIERGADLDAMDYKGKTPIEVAERWRYIDERGKYVIAILEGAKEKQEKNKH